MLPWWKKGVIYQIYPKSFYDSNNDGIGDLKGITCKLDYLQSLQVDAIWLCPVYASPMMDNGYDVSDYYSINPLFGTMDDMIELINEAKKRNIRIIMDLVCNHTSTSHEWFKKAISEVNSPYQDYYFFKDKPLDYKSSFGCSAFEYVKEINKYYYHYFDKSQADLNWGNKKVIEEVIKIVNFWMDLGVSGFRLDAIELIGKDLDKGIFANGEKIHEYLNTLYLNAFSKNPEFMTVGEGWPTPDVLNLYTKASRNELNLMFQFETSTLDWGSGITSKYKSVNVDFRDLINKTDKWMTSIDDDAWNTLFFENHDLGRTVSRYFNDDVDTIVCSKLLAIYLFFLKGTIFLYQGEELGMTNYESLTLDEINDIDTLTKYKELVNELSIMNHDDFLKGALKNSRDNARCPFPWSNDLYGGFSKVKPWLKVSEKYKLVNAQALEKDETSVLNFYKKLISDRTRFIGDVVVLGTYKRITDVPSDVYAFVRYYNDITLTILLNFSSNEYCIKTSNLVEEDYNILINNMEKLIKTKDSINLLPYQGLVLVNDRRKESK